MHSTSSSPPQPPLHESNRGFKTARLRAGHRDVGRKGDPLPLPRKQSTDGDRRRAGSGSGGRRGRAGRHGGGRRGVMRVTWDLPRMLGPRRGRRRRPPRLMPKDPRPGRMLKGPHDPARRLLPPRVQVMRWSRQKSPPPRKEESPVHLMRRKPLGPGKGRTEFRSRLPVGPRKVWRRGRGPWMGFRQRGRRPEGRRKSCKLTYFHFSLRRFFPFRRPEPTPVDPNPCLGGGAFTRPSHHSDGKVCRQTQNTSSAQGPA